MLAKIYGLLPEKVAPGVIGGPILPAAAVVGAPPADPGAIDVSAPSTIDDLMKVGVMKAREAWVKPNKTRAKARVKPNEAGTEPWVNANDPRAKAAVEARVSTPAKSTRAKHYG